MFPQQEPNPLQADSLAFTNIEDEVKLVWRLKMSEQDLEVLITLDDPGEDDLEEDTFHNRQAEITGQPVSNKASDTIT